MCFFPSYWNDNGKKNNIDQLIEKTLFYHFKNELEKRGLIVEYIEPSKLIYNSETGVTKTVGYEPCDLVLSIFYSQNMGSLKVPAQSAGSLWVTPTYGSGGYGSVGSYDINYYNLFISSGLFLGKSADVKKVWSASITKGSPKPDLEEQSAEMVKKLINKKFPK